MAREVDGRLFFDSKSVEILGVEVERQPVTELSHRLRPNPSDGKYKVQFNAARMPPKPFTQLGFELPIMFHSRRLTRVRYALVADNAAAVEGELELRIPAKDT